MNEDPPAAQVTSKAFQPSLLQCLAKSYPTSAHAAVDRNNPLRLKRELLRIFKIPLHSYLIFVATCNGGLCLC